MSCLLVFQRWWTTLFQIGINFSKCSEVFLVWTERSTYIEDGEETGLWKESRKDRRYGSSRWNRISLFDYYKEKNIMHTDLSPPTNESHIESTIGPHTRFRLFASINYKLLQGSSSSEQISLRSIFLRSGKRRENVPNPDSVSTSGSRVINNRTRRRIRGKRKRRERKRQDGEKRRKKNS